MCSSAPSEVSQVGRRVRGVGPLVGAALILLPLAGLGTGCGGSDDGRSAPRAVVVTGRVVTTACPEVRSPPPGGCPASPIAGATVVVLDAGGVAVVQTTTADDGTFRLATQLTPGPCTIRATGPQPGAAGPATASATVTVTDGSPEQRVSDLELRLDTGIR